MPIIGGATPKASVLHDARVFTYRKANGLKIGSVKNIAHISFVKDAGFVGIWKIRWYSALRQEWCIHDFIIDREAIRLL